MVTKQNSEHGTGPAVVRVEFVIIAITATVKLWGVGLVICLYQGADLHMV